MGNQWNQCEIIVIGDQYVIHKLNGEVANVATNMNVGKGKIGFQSETAEIFYRNITITEVTDPSVPLSSFLK